MFVVELCERSSHNCARALFSSRHLMSLVSYAGVSRGKRFGAKSTKGLQELGGFTILSRATYISTAIIPGLREDRGILTKQ